MKFWQKNYFITLVLFTVFISASFIILLTMSESRGYSIESEQRLAEQHYIAQLLSNDAASVAQRRPEALPALAASYVEEYHSSGVLIEITNDGEVWGSRLPAGSPEMMEVPAVGERMHMLAYVGDVPYLYITARLPQPDSIVLTCAFDMSGYFSSTETLRQLSIVIAIVAVAVLAVILYFVLRKLSRPMEQLADVAKILGEGDYSARSDYKGGDEVGRLAVSFNNLAQNVEQNINVLQATAEEKQNLADTLAHEIRTPLTAVEGYAQYLQIAAVDEGERQESLQYIIEESRRLSNMCATLLQMASLRGEKARREEVELNELILKAYRAVTTRRRTSGVRVTTYKREESFVKGESILLESLIINLMDNAVKACTEGDMVRVYTEKQQGKTLLIVQDNGCGISPEQLEHMGEQFYRPDKARSREQGGAGLGIALCYEIARSHDAKITYDSKLNEGTKVTVKFTT